VSEDEITRSDAAVVDTRAVWGQFAVGRTMNYVSGLENNQRIIN